ncbi:MAG: 2-oxoglutarate dehydrogenase E1 component [Acidobacteria bacterium]|nr:2-oxoglutarate dehydrogenase E1 component [Acidobacteriota bacterium]
MGQGNTDFLYEFFGPNAGYVLELYDRYLQNPQSVDAATRALFEQWPAATPNDSSGAPTATLDKIVGAVNLAQALRDYGHLSAHLDPLEEEPDLSLDVGKHGLSEQDLRQLPANLVGGPVSEAASNALEAIQSLHSIYSSTTGYDWSHIRVKDERSWLRTAAESGRFRPPQVPFDPTELLKRLTEVEVFELFLHRIFPGKFRFSLEGLDMLVPMLDEIIEAAVTAGIRNALLGMGHRGRLNVMAQVLNKKFAEILAEFKDPLQGRHFRDDLGWTGDVKYHMGASRTVADGRPIGLSVALVPNPSHLEAVNPVVEGMARAAGSAIGQPGPARFDPTLTLPILIHGDAAFTGQGIVAETLNLSRVPGFNTGGTIHIIANNQLGFTTEPEAIRSTLYASDLAKGFEIPVVHVNADDPEACLEAARIAFAYRTEFKKDFLIDLIGYRRHGHNEMDEPAFTQPSMYRKIREHPTVRELWARTLLRRHCIEQHFAEELVRQQMESLQQASDSLEPEKSLVEPVPEPPPREVAKQVATSVTEDRLRALGAALWQVPNDFSLHPKIRHAMERRKQALEQEPGTVDWSMAEELAFGSMLEEGIAIRLSGEDTERGTFSQRHSVFHNSETGESFVPLQSLPQAKASFEVCNSPLSENAALGFEYGYCIQRREQLVIWEAQYGDFINGAQVIVDEFLVSGRAKWGQVPSLVLLLPHGYEGQGPDHSSARLERFLQLAVDQNIRVANCTTAAQYFHLLRRQALLLKVDPLPLVILTPKSLLRHPRVASPLQDFTEGGWQPVIDDEAAERNPDEIRNLIVCHGKTFIDLVSHERREASPHIAIIRIEQLYPYPSDELKTLLGKYRHLEKVCWVQEEPENMGAWNYLRPHLCGQLRGRWPLCYIGRPPSSSPAEGSAARHAVTQKAIIEQAYNPEAVLEHEEAAWVEKRDGGSESGERMRVPE